MNEYWITIQICNFFQRYVLIWRSALFCTPWTQFIQKLHVELYSRQTFFACILVQRVQKIKPLYVNHEPSLSRQLYFVKHTAIKRSVYSSSLSWDRLPLLFQLWIHFIRQQTLKWSYILSHMKSDNLQYNMLARWVDGTKDSSTKRLML